MLENLININRYSGTHLIKSESTSDHVWHMISLALETIPNMNRKRVAYGYPEVNIKELIYKIALHDLDEAFYTDIPRPFKHFDTKITSEINRVAESLMRLNVSEELIQQINSAKDSTLEGLYVKIFDFVQSGEKMILEVMLGNQIIKQEIPNVIGCLEDLIELKLYEDDFRVEKAYVSEQIEKLKKYV